MRRLSVLANEALALERKGHTKPETQPVHASLDGSIKMWMRPENHPDLKAWLASPRLRHVGLSGPCGAARKPAVPTRADLCYGVVDREIVATKCA